MVKVVNKDRNGNTIDIGTIVLRLDEFPLVVNEARRIAERKEVDSA